MYRCPTHTPRNFAHALVDARARAQNYEAVDGECKPYGVCETCSPGPGGAAGPPVKNCTKVHNRHPLHRTTPRGSLPGRDYRAHHPGHDHGS